MREFLEQINREKLLDFLVGYADRDSRFANAINVHFGEPEFNRTWVNSPQLCCVK